MRTQEQQLDLAEKRSSVILVRVVCGMHGVEARLQGVNRRVKIVCFKSLGVKPRTEIGQ